jgi:integrase
VAGGGSASGRRPEGIQFRHTRACRSRFKEPCSCKPRYQAQVWSAHDKKPIRKTFATIAEAKAWRAESQVALKQRTLRAPSQIRLREAAAEWLSAAQAGVVRTRSGDPYKPSALRCYRQALNGKLLPRLGEKRVTTITPNLVQDLVDQMVAAGAAPSTVRNAILPLRAIYRRATARGEVAINPTLKLALPAVRGRRDTITPPQQAEALIAAVPANDQALWATAFYAGLRRGELQALRWHDIDLDQRLVHVNHSWDHKAGLINPKSRSGKRRIPITNHLRHYLLTHKLQQASKTTEFVFPNQHGNPFDPVTIHKRARKAWATHNLDPVTLHDCRHAYASYAIAAGINTKALSTYMGHASITITLDRYGHLLPGNEHQAAQLLHTWLTNTTEPQLNRHKDGTHDAHEAEGSSPLRWN